MGRVLLKESERGPPVRLENSVYSRMDRNIVVDEGCLAIVKQCSYVAM